MNSFLIVGGVMALVQGLLCVLVAGSVYSAPTEMKDGKFDILMPSVQPHVVSGVCNIT